MTPTFTSPIPRWGLGLLAGLVTGLAVSGCSSDSSGGDPATLATTNNAPAPAPPPPGPGGPGGPPPPPGPGGPGGPGGPPPAPDDATVLAALADAGIATPATAPAESAAMIELGRNLFFDKLLSGNRNISCATCHHPTAGTGDDLPLSLGEGASGIGAARTPSAVDQTIPRNAPPLFSLGAQGVNRMFWDSRVRRDPDTGALTTPEPLLNGATPVRADLAAQLTTALAAQAMFPVTSPEEMRGDAGENELADAASNEAVWALLMARLVGTADGTVGGIDAYRTLFRAAFPTNTNYDELTFAHAARAIAAFEASTWALFNAPLDRYLAGDAAALTADAKRGALLFTGRARCDRCHSGPLLSDFRHHALAVPQLGPGKGGEADDRGLALISGDPNDSYRFRTPPLRNVTRTGPWFHSGAFADLRDVLRHYRNPGNSLLDYDPSAHLPAFFQSQVDADVTRNQARIAAVDPIVGNGLNINEADIDALLAFLQALEDPAAATPVPVPSSVPSGIAVD